MYVTPIGYGFPKIYSHLECNSSELLNIFNSGFFLFFKLVSFSVLSRSCFEGDFS